MEMNYQKGELEQIQNELHVEILPGTEIMTDVGSHHFVKGSDSSRVLVPQPSADKHDPLNWSPAWKSAAIFAAALVTFTQGFAPLANSPFIPNLMQEFGCTLDEAIQFTSIPILILGFSNFLWVPISNAWGRRPVLIISQIICLASYAWRAKATSYDSFMGACIINGIGSGPVETMMPAIIADIFFLHDRGKWNTLYWVLYMGALMIAPIVSGAMTEHLVGQGSWRNYWYLNVAITGFSIVYTVFAFPETMWHRVHPGQTDASSTENVKAGDSSEKAATENTTEQTGHSDPWVGKGSPSKAQWQLFQPNSRPLQTIISDLIVPWKLFTFPIVHFGAFVTSWSCSNFLILNLTQSFVFGPPYNFTAEQIGFTNFAILAGAGIGLFTAGPLSDWVAARATAKNNGIREPEMRLPAMIPYVIIMIIGNIVTAIGYMKLWPWEVIVIVGYTCAGIQVAGLPGIASTYAVDSYKPVAGSVFVAITVNKNLWGYGMGKFIVPWTVGSGVPNYYPAFFVNMALTVLWCLFGIVCYYYGKTFRRWSRNSKVHQM